jgi:hypothetical protein
MSRAVPPPAIAVVIRAMITTGIRAAPVAMARAVRSAIPSATATVCGKDDRRGRGDTWLRCYRHGLRFSCDETEDDGGQNRQEHFCHGCRSDIRFRRESSVSEDGGAPTHGLNKLNTDDDRMTIEWIESALI